ncbi:Inorganic triphosphatase YgiF, contains CYTH and CHAD domains [Lentzea fradiae]|uniref:Inorganic triphosphatase YgiF, contains CYTH and CHAD domains n=1 Tax=Lentzea fradiae TaxID=200378 RepID=A0A1G7SAI3_9PSEU|nr:CYTH and CHAD domain-containing protein [Lentzea fradiae]SDG20056.1 Inorganic triphosphatase YgiF, contains CYTH and CHAD domains [Lentzea fradiae]
MATSVTETERKYEAPSDASLPDLAEITGVATGPEEFDLEATYFDTPDYRLARAGVTLRRRVGGEDEGWHLKLPVSQDSRQELRVPLGEAVKTPPEDLTTLVRAHTRGAALTPVAEIRTNRRRWQLANSTGDLLAEVVDDVVTAQTLGSSTSTTAWREIEVELGDTGTHDLLDTVERHLADAGIHPSSSKSKLSQVIGVKRDAVPTVTKKSTAGEVVLAYLHEQRAALQNQDPRVRTNEADAIHQMRVATRRLRSALQAYGKVIDREATKALTDELKWLASVLGTARDLEVLRARFEEALNALPPELVLGDVKARTTRHFAPQEAKAHNDSVAALDSDRYFALLNAIDDLLTTPPLTELAGRKAKKVLPTLVNKAHSRLADRVNTALSTTTDDSLHEARKAAKRLRYSAEVAEPSLGKQAKALRKRAKAVQTLLGDHQDSVVARPVLLTLGRGDENGFTFGLLYGREVELANKTAAELPATWAKLKKTRL